MSCFTLEMDELRASTDTDVDAVLAVCPDLDRDDIRADLAVSGSVEATINRALDGNFLADARNSHVGYIDEGHSHYDVQLSRSQINAPPSFSVRENFQRATNSPDNLHEIDLSTLPSSSRVQPFATMPNERRLPSKHSGRGKRFPISSSVDTVDIPSSDSDSELVPFPLSSRTVIRTSTQEGFSRNATTVSSNSRMSSSTCSLGVNRWEQSPVSSDSPERLDTTPERELHFSSSAKVATRDTTTKSSAWLYNNDIALSTDSAPSGVGISLTFQREKPCYRTDIYTKRKQKETDDLVLSSGSDVDSCGVVVNAPKKRMRFSAEERQRRKEEKERQKAEKQALQEAERKRKQLEKVRQKAERQFGNDVRRAGNRDNCIKTVQVVLDERLKDTPTWHELDSMLQEFELRVTFDRLPVERSITWRRINVEGTFSEDSQEMLRSEQFSEEKFAVVMWSAKEFIQCVHESLGDSPDTPLSVAGQSLQDACHGKEVTLLIEGVENYLHCLSREGKRTYRNAVLSLGSIDSQAKSNAGGRSKQSGKGRKEDLISVSRVQVEEALVTLQLFCPGLRVRLTESAVDTAQLLFQLSKAVASRPRVLEEINPFGFYADNCFKAVKVSNKGEGLLEVWQHQFRQFYNVGEEKAAAVASVFPSPRLLCEALERCKSKEESESLLTRIEVRRGTGVLGRTTHIGKVFAEQLCHYTLSRDGTAMVAGSTLS